MLLGQAWLHRELSLRVPEPRVQSRLGGVRATEHDGSRTILTFPRPYAVDNQPLAHLRFALVHEGIDLGVLNASLSEIGPSPVEEWVRRQPTGTYSRRAWFFYETFVGATLDVENVRSGNYVEALSPSHHLVSSPRRSKRHRVLDNLLGGPDLCVTVRRTPELIRQLSESLDEEAKQVCASVDAAQLARALNYLYTKETRSSFAIEGETPSPNRAERFVAALRKAADFDACDKDALIDLQKTIVEPRYAASDWRTTQNFVGETVSGYRERVHYICPRPEDVAHLMSGWMALARRVVDDGLPPVVAAAAVAFPFVFVHPFDDGNGRIHRFLIHQALAQRGFGPPNALLPVSAAIERDVRGYDEVLESFSEPLRALIDWRLTDDGFLTINGETRDLYRFVDATPFAEYLHARVAESIRHDLHEELAFVSTFDRALTAMRDIVDMPDRRASLFARLTMQNNGTLSRRKRSQFYELGDEEVAALEAAVRAAIRQRPSTPEPVSHS